jgi:hypothetical protein
MLWPVAATGEADIFRLQYTRTRSGASWAHGCSVTSSHAAQHNYGLDLAGSAAGGLAMTSDGLRLLQDLRRSLLDPPCQLWPPAVTAIRDGDRPENVSATA